MGRQAPALALILLTALAMPDDAAAQGRAGRAAPRSDRNSQLAHEQLLEKARRGRVDVYFAGDSIVRRWGALDYPALLANWRENFFGWNAANFGWGGDRTENILWRLENGELDGVQPRIIVLLAGTNDIGSAPPPAADEALVSDVAGGIEAILHVMRAKAPGATIVLTAIFPRSDNRAAVPTIDRINARIAALADGRTIRFLNINDRLAGPDGTPVEGMMPDGLHPSVKAYQVWADALKPIFAEILGAPAGVDSAPPPTGDPSAQ